jgi:hypothetical protein
MNCNWPALTQGTPCIRCGTKLPRDYDAPPVCECGRVRHNLGLQPKHYDPAPGLGDQVESLLASIGITEDRYKEVKEKFGLPPTCNCPARKEFLNRVSEWWRSIRRESG